MYPRMKGLPSVAQSSCVACKHQRASARSLVSAMRQSGMGVFLPYLVTPPMALASLR